MKMGRTDKYVKILNRQYKSVFTVDDNDDMPMFSNWKNAVFEVDLDKMFCLNELEKRLEKEEQTGCHELYCH